MQEHRNLTVASVIATALALPIAVQADDYRWEAGGAFNRIEGDGDHSDFWNIYGTYYFRDVKTDGLPLAEAAYLGRSSFISLAPTRFESDLGNFDAWRVSADYYVPNNWLYLSAGVTRWDTLEPNPADPAAAPVRGHRSEWDASIGITPLDGLRISTSFYQDAGYDPNIDIKFVGRLGNDHYYGFGVRARDPDDDDVTYLLTADYFIDRTLRIGAEGGDSYYGISADKFFTEKASVGLHYSDEGGFHNAGLRAAWRF